MRTQFDYLHPSPFTFKQRARKATYSYRREWWKTPSSSLLFADRPVLVQPKLSVKAIKKTWLKCHCAVINLINGSQFTPKPLNNGGPGVYSLREIGILKKEKKKKKKMGFLILGSRPSSFL